MAQFSLEKRDVSFLDIYTNPHDVRRDLAKYIQYISTHSVKRMYRNNEIPSADQKRLSQLLGVSGEDSTGIYSWVEVIDELALNLGFVSYDTEGEYVGYTSSEPSYPNNFIEFQQEAYERFFELSLLKQEQFIFNKLVDKFDYSNNEFILRSFVGQLDTFSQWGSANGILPSINFAQGRRFLFNFLAQNCEAGVWYSTLSLVATLKKTAPYFLIPEKPRTARSGLSNGRYASLHEKEIAGFNDEGIPETAPDGFERVEGRYIERFLEGIPLLLGYLEVAYTKNQSAKFLALNQLQAFSLNERFSQLMKGDIPQPTLIVQPNFEMYVVSSFYPVKLINQLSAIAEVVKDETPTLLLKLQKQKVASYVAEHDKANVIKLLESLSGVPLPQNVAYDLKAWSGQAEVFTLYDGFGLLEGTLPPSLSTSVLHKVAQTISDNLALITWPEELQKVLQANNVVTILVRHENNNLRLLPERAQTLFVSENTAPLPEKSPTQKITIKQEPLLKLYLPSDKIWEQVRKALLNASCPVEADKEKRTLTIKSSHEPILKQALETLKSEYNISLENIG